MKAAFIHFQIVGIAKSVTGETDNQTAIMKFREKLNSSESYFNPEPIPKNESDKEAHRKCSDIEGAKKYCPKRWAALQLWFAESRKAGLPGFPRYCCNCCCLICFMFGLNTL